tara:strand:- start:2498 stop:2644 length:147 start_codon:yes stop_codon:yes gene_type:complete
MNSQDNFSVVYWYYFIGRLEHLMGYSYKNGDEKIIKKIFLSIVAEFDY